MSTGSASLVRDLFNASPTSIHTARASANQNSPTAAVAARAYDGLRHDIEEHEYPELQAELSRALDGLCAKSASGDYTDLTSELIELLRVLKGSTSDRVWQEAVLPAARAHRITAFIHECPFTSHSFSRPRGYPGDAGLLDFVYRHPDARPATEKATDGGRTVMSFTVNVSACEAVRQRKEVLARKIDEIAELRPGAEVLAIACGHLREAESSIALQQGKLGRLLATDQDQISLERVAAYRETISSKIDVKNLSVRNFITARHGLGEFDLVYAAGLYDYLDARMAARLTSSLFSLLKSGGRLLIPNFRTGVNEEAYMEVYMDWYLIYRSVEEIKAFADQIPSDQIRNTDYFEDETGTIGYLELEKL
jgi:hypothetical protein